MPLTRLKAAAREREENFNYLALSYALERLLYRLSKSRHRDSFVLKGAMLFRIWQPLAYRTTLDVDLLSQGPPDLSRMEGVFREIADHKVEDDGMMYDPATVIAGQIREDNLYQGVRVKLNAFLGEARMVLQIDVGFGDAVFPKPEARELPPILPFPAPVLKTYCQEASIAEKFHAMVALDSVNSRMKDFYDIWVLAREFDFAGVRLGGAIGATFERRSTALPTAPPLALTAEFAHVPGKQVQWRAFLRRTGLDAPDSLMQVVDELAAFLWPMLIGLATGAMSVANLYWPAKGPWREKVDKA